MTVTATAKRAPRFHRFGQWMTRHLVLVVLVVMALITLAPIALVALNAFKNSADYASGGPLGLPKSLYFHGLHVVWNEVDFTKKLENSLIVSVIVAFGAVILSVLNGYALGIGHVRGRKPILVLCILAFLVPREALFYPLIYAAKELNMYDSLIPVIVFFTVAYSGFGTFLLASVYSEFPKEMLESAVVDGAGRWRTLWRIVVPISRPTLMVMFVFFFIWSWNEFYLPLVFLISNSNQTVPVGLAVLQGQYVSPAATQAASGLLGVLPAIFFFLIFQRTISRGILAGAIK